MRKDGNSSIRYRITAAALAVALLAGDVLPFSVNLRSVRAQEAVQEAFLSAWKHLPSFRGEAGFSTWLYRLTVNACNDLFRRRKAPAGLLSLDDEEETLQLRDPQPLPQEEAERSELRRNVQQALLQLSPPRREVLLLRELQQLSYEEISSILSLDPGTVKSRIHRARNQLREQRNKRGKID